MSVDSEPDVARRVRILAPFRHRDYRWLALAMAMSTFTSGVWAVALVWEVIRLGGEPSNLSLVAAAGALGIMIPALAGGVVADRVPQMAILIAVTCAQLAMMTAAAMVSALDLATLPILVILSFGLGVGIAFYYPAYSSWLPVLVPGPDLQAVNGFEGMVRPGLQQAFGPAVAGAAVAAAEPSLAMALAALALLLGLVALTRIPGTPVAARDGEVVPTVWQDVRHAVMYARSTPWFSSTLLFAALMILVIVGPIEVLIPFLLKDHLGGGPQGHSFVLAAFGIGGVLGSLIMGSLPMPRRYLSVMVLLWGAGCLPFAVVGTTDRLVVVVLAALVVGACFSAPNVIWGTLLQRRVPAHLLGRVSSLDFFVSLSLMPVSMALAGPVSELIGLQRTFLWAGVLPVLLAVLVIVGARLPADEAAHPLDS